MYEGSPGPVPVPDDTLYGPGPVPVPDDTLYCPSRAPVTFPGPPEPLYKCRMGLR